MKNQITELWDTLVDNGLATEQTLQVITSINGYTLETLNDVLYAITGCRCIEQYHAEGVQIDAETRENTSRLKTPAKLQEGKEDDPFYSMAEGGYFADDNSEEQLDDFDDLGDSEPITSERIAEWLSEPIDQILPIQVERSGFQNLSSLLFALIGGEKKPPRVDNELMNDGLAKLLHYQKKINKDRSLLSLGELDQIISYIRYDPSDAIALEVFRQDLELTKDLMDLHEEKSLFLEHYEKISRWFKKNASGNSGKLNLILKILLSRAMRQEKKYEEAFEVLCDAFSQSGDADINNERKWLTKEFESVTESASVHFDRFDRIPTKRIRHGGLSFVIPVQENQTKEPYAIKRSKLVPADSETMQKYLNTFEREITFLRSCNHPNIIRFVDRLASNAILLEWFPGRTLQEELDDRTKLSEGHTLEILGQVASAMSHVVGIYPDFSHNDLVPRNIMVDFLEVESQEHLPEKIKTDEIDVRLIDFGISHSPDMSTIGSFYDDIGVRHTEVYRSPEFKEGIYHHKANDLYSFGITGYQCLFGEFPDVSDLCKWEKSRDNILAQLKNRTAAETLASMINPKVECRPNNWAEISKAFTDEKT